MTTRIRIFYPADPVGIVPGGIDTFLRGLIKWAPADLEFSLVGMTTDPEARPPGVWTRCHIGERAFEFFPVVSVSDAGGRGKIPLSLRFSIGVSRHRSAVSSGFDIFDFHRPEPSLLFKADLRPKNAYFHNDPDTIHLKQSDNLWRRLPNIYENLERYALDSFDSVWCVRESGVQTLRQRYPKQAAQIRFIPTWVDADVFNCVDEQSRHALRQELAEAHGLDDGAQWIVSVGRLDTQKDPMLMLSAFALLIAQKRQVNWLVIGDGVLRPALEKGIQEAGLGKYVRFLGLLPPTKIADVLRAADVYALSSAYEGMPMALLEALGCGLPAVVTDVGEVRRVVKPGINGVIVTSPDAEKFAAGLIEVLDNAINWYGLPAQSAVEEYQPGKVLRAAYENYRQLGKDCARLRKAVETHGGDDAWARRRGPVIGMPIDILDQDSASKLLLDWARKHESRTACFANVHSVVLARYDERHRLVLRAADMVAPDGAPIAWTLKRKGHRAQRRLDGPTLMLRICADAEVANIKIGLYGSTQETLTALEKNLRQSFPKLLISYVYSPPFRELTEEEDVAICGDIAAAEVGLLFVGLGCPKQEFWMERHRDRIPAVMLGVGAAFEFHAGSAPRAPEWMRKRGLEWLHRLIKHPRRLWRRYMFSNSIFLAMTAREALLHLGNCVNLSRR
jgi:exopolysaccharide biosynthesis WecB/TagA/CpsF family protein